jgi:hypothetical protein
MPTISRDVPETLRPYGAHGLDLQYRDSDKEALADCPYCGRENKFSVNIETGQYRCVVCDESGNAYIFLRKLWDISRQGTSDEEYEALAESRGLLDPETPKHWGCCKSVITGDWLVPGYGPSGEICQLYRYIKSTARDRMLLLPTPMMGHQLFGVDLKVVKGMTVWLTEGPWDGMALWELLQRTKEVDGRLSITGSPEHSLLANSCVLSVAGCGAMGDPFAKYLPLFAECNVRLCFDNDHPHKNPKTGELEDPAGYMATKRAVGLLGCAKTPPECIEWVRWGASDGWEGVDLSLPGGYDLREHFGTAEEPTWQARARTLGSLFSLLSPIPGEWAVERKKKASGGLECRSCTSYARLVNSWRKAMKWTDGLDHALAVMLASVSSTKTLGDQLWFRIIGPPSCGKTTLAEAFSVNKEYIKAVSTLRGFHSGYMDESGEDISLMAQAKDKTVVVKDGDPLLQAPNRGQILAEMRDIYDTTSRTSYRNKASRDYENHRLTVLLCGTSALRELDDSELGARLLDCVLMEEIDDELEDEILWRVVNRSAAGLCLEVNGKVEANHDPDMLEAMQLTGGYVSWLRENAVNEMSKLTISEDVRYLCTRLGKFVAHLRARPSKRQTEVHQREFASRLVSQLMRLAGCLALVLNKKHVDAEVMARVKRVALDTSRGTTLKIVRYLYDNPDGVVMASAAGASGQTNEEGGRLLRFLRQIRVVEAFELDDAAVKGSRVRYRLTARMRKLWRVVHDED